MPISDAVTAIDRDLREMFGDRLRSVVAYAVTDRVPGTPQPMLVIVEALTPADLRDCAARVARWQESGLATPLFLETAEFPRSLDVFPFEFGAILADHVVVSGEHPFGGLQIDAEGLRGAGAQSPSAFAGGLYRDTRTKRCAGGAHHAIVGAAVGAAQKRRPAEG